MNQLPWKSSRLVAASILCTATLIIASCADAPRPVLTGDRIADSAAVPAATAAIPAPAVAPNAGDTATTDTGATDAAPGLAVSTPAPDPDVPSTTNPAPQLESLTIEVIESFPHDTAAFTQGLEIHGGVLFESTGRVGESDLRRVTLATGEVSQIIATPSGFFAEGLTKVGDEFVQLTWQDQTAFYWDATTFEQTRLVSYGGEGWGLCYDGARLIMTDGSASLIFRDPDSFAELGRIGVTLNGSPLEKLNELECVDGQVWANVWQTNLIVRIDPATGVVNAVVDASSLVRQDGASVLNGIAWDASTQTFLVTGKLWDTLYRVNFVPVSN